jgi:hypothetical protein
MPQQPLSSLPGESIRAITLAFGRCDLPYYSYSVLKKYSLVNAHSTSERMADLVEIVGR